MSSLPPPLPSGDPNPYAVTSNSPYGLQPNTDVRNEIYQAKGFLIMHKQAVLPDRCIKSNEATQERLKRSLYWHHPGFYLLILFNLIVYAVVALIIRKSAVLQIPLSAPFKRRRIRNMLIAWTSVLLAIGCFVVAISILDGRSQNPMGTVLLIAFPFLLIFGTFFGLYGCRVVYAKKIDDHFVWLGGVSKEFQQSFPAWPY